MTQNQRVNEAVYEELKMLCSIGERCTLEFRADNGGIVRVETKIKDVFADEDRQYLLAENALTMQLHQLVSINGKSLGAFC